MAAAQAVAAKLEGKTVVIKAKGGASGRLHGKVTGKEVAEALAQLAGSPIDKKKIELETRDIKDAGRLQRQSPPPCRCRGFLQGPGRSGAGLI